MRFLNTWTPSKIWSWNSLSMLMKPGLWQARAAITSLRFSSIPSSATCSRWSLASSSSRWSRRLRISTRLSLRLRRHQLWFKRGCRPWLIGWVTVNCRPHLVITKNRSQDHAYLLVEWPNSVSKCNKPPKLFSSIPKCTLPLHSLPTTKRRPFLRLPPVPPTSKFINALSPSLFSKSPSAHKNGNQPTRDRLSPASK